MIAAGGGGGASDENGGIRGVLAVLGAEHMVGMARIWPAAVLHHIAPQRHVGTGEQHLLHLAVLVVRYLERLNINANSGADVTASGSSSKAGVWGLIDGTGVVFAGCGGQTNGGGGGDGSAYMAAVAVASSGCTVQRQRWLAPLMGRPLSVLIR